MKDEADTRVRLSNAIAASISVDEGIGTIRDDDGAPTLSIDDIRIFEGDVGTTNAEFTVSLSRPSDQDLTVQYVTDEGSAAAGEVHELPASSVSKSISSGAARNALKVQ